MLGCIDRNGELVRLFWPDIDYAQQIDRLNVGVICPELWQGASWLDSQEWQAKQHYVPDTNIAVTEYTRAGSGIAIRQTDFVLPDSDVFSRSYEAENTSGSRLTVSFAVFSSCVSTTPNSAGIIFDTRLSALIPYRHGYYYSVSSPAAVLQYQLGEGSKENAGCGQLCGNDTIGMTKEGALIWDGTALESGQRTQFGLRLCFARDLRSLKSLIIEQDHNDIKIDIQRAELFWHSYLAGLRKVNTGNGEIDALYKRSLLVFALMTNKKTGAILAAPEVDEEFTRCGRYSYCWGRDAAFIADALDRCGLSEDVERFYRWTAMVQDDDGSWQQRFYTDGNLAPSWGLQVDESGSIIMGILKHYEATGNIQFLRDLWPAVNKGIEFMLSYMDAETGLPWLSFDLWEERLGEHAYSSAAVCAGIEAGAAIAEILAEKSEVKIPTPAELVSTSEAWKKAAAALRKSIEESFWHPEWNRFIRSIRVKLNGWGEEHTDAKVWLKTNDRSICRDYSLIDGALDISLLGLSVPFGIYSSDDPRMVSTAQIVEQQLGIHQAGGLMRYEYDGYIGGNPWVLATLWAALYHIERKTYKKALDYLNWAVKSATEQGLLPEQVDKNTGEPAWVIPLTWSHAMFILVLDGLIAAGELQES
jgi:glucoamylase